MRKLGVDEFTPKHYKEIFLLAKSWWEKISPIPLIEEDVYRCIDIGKELGGAWVDNNDNIIGYYFLTIYPHPFNLGYTVGDLASICIKEEYRSSTLFLRMITDIISTCNLYEVDELNFSDTIQRPLSSVMKKLEFEQTGMTYRRKIYGS